MENLLWYVILGLSILSIVVAVLILKKGLRDAREMDFDEMSMGEYISYHKNEPEEYSPEFYFDESDIKRLRGKMDKKSKR
jgi:hypothetical protein